MGSGFPMQSLLLATRNPNKTREFRELLGPEFDLRDLSSFAGAAIPEETGRTFAENAISKAMAVSQDPHLFVVADDSGLEVDSLGGAPGIYSARYAGKEATDEQNIDKLLKELARRNAPADRRTARFRCVIALARGEESIGTFEGIVEGRIVNPPRGRGGFGYDPVFQPDGFNQTFGEMDAQLKNRISHRAKAITALREALLKTKQL
jgi:XTP/dITP diphosphohydrolase